VLFLILGLSCAVSDSVSTGDGVAADPNLITFSRIDRAWTDSRGKNAKAAVMEAARRKEFDRSSTGSWG